MRRHFRRRRFGCILTRSAGLRGASKAHRASGLRQVFRNAFGGFGSGMSLGQRVSDDPAGQVQFPGLLGGTRLGSRTRTLQRTGEWKRARTASWQVRRMAYRELRLREDIRSPAKRCFRVAGPQRAETSCASQGVPTPRTRTIVRGATSGWRRSSRMPPAASEPLRLHMHTAAYQLTRTMATLGHNPLAAITIALQRKAVDCLDQDDQAERFGFPHCTGNLAIRARNDPAQTASARWDPYTKLHPGHWACR